MTMEMKIAMRKAPNTLLLALIKMIALVVCLEGHIVNDNDSAGGEFNSYSSSSTSNGGRDDGALIIIEHCIYVVV